MYHHPPPNSSDRCSCELSSIDENFYKLVPHQPPQMKPKDTCIWQFESGGWLKKKGWNADAERELGGDGYHRFLLWDTSDDGTVL
jgi:alpha 1,2-mannosyltransferase